MEPWWDCYLDNWGDLIVKAAYQHPAKMARGLAYRIVTEGLARGWWKPGDEILDPFGGIGTTGLVAAAHGLRAVLVELEPKFVELAGENFKLHARDWAAARLPAPLILQGDSRDMINVLIRSGHADLVREVVRSALASPPFSPPGNQPVIGQGARSELAKIGKLPEQEYGQTAGQIGSMPGIGAVGSPPYADSLQNAGTGRAKLRGSDAGMPADYGDNNPGQIGAMSSPPYAGTRFDGGEAHGGKVPYREAGNYSQDPQNLGNTEANTYWEACAAVYRQLFGLMSPGGTVALVVKAYVKAGQVIDLPSQTFELLAGIGFEPMLWVNAMLIAKESQPDMFTGAEKRRKSASFFRRLYESKHPENAIDAEVVLVARKP